MGLRRCFPLHKGDVSCKAESIWSLLLSAAKWKAKQPHATVLSEDGELLKTNSFHACDVQTQMKTGLNWFLFM